MNTRILTYAGAGVAAACLLASTERSARAQTSVACNTLTANGPQIVIQSGDTQEPLLKSLGQKLRNSATMPMTILYNLTGTCTITGNMIASTPLKVNPNYIPSSTEMPTWDPSMPSPTCTIDTTAGVPIDVGIAATYPESCNLGALPAPLGEVRGPIQAYGFVVPKASDQQAIIAEEGYFVFGFGNNDQVTPWNNEMFMFIRPPTKSTILTMAAAISVPAAKWKGQPQNMTSQVISAVSTSTSPEATIGILGIEDYDANRSALTSLAFQAYKQHHAYLPDSTAGSFDKRNMRDGHYFPWAPTVYITAVDASNNPTNANVKYLTDLVLGNPIAGTDVDGLATVISKSLVPDCAMRVNRSTEGGNFSLYTPASPCGCYFDSKVPNGSTSCTACTDSSTCGGGTCVHNYCEVQ